LALWVGVTVRPRRRNAETKEQRDMDDDNNLNETATFLDREPPTVLSGGTTTGVVVPATAEATAPPPQPDEGLEKAEWQQDGVSESILEKAEARFKQGMSELKTESAKDAATPGRVGSRLVTKTAALADALGLEFGWKVVLQVLRRMQVVRDAAPHVPTDAGPTYLCPECTGSGLIDGTAENGGKRLACPPCNGNGLVQFVGGWPSAHPCVVVFVCSEADARLVARRVTRYPRIVRINLDGVHGGRGNHPARKSDFVQCPECAGQGSPGDYFYLACECCAGQGVVYMQGKRATLASRVVVGVGNMDDAADVAGLVEDVACFVDIRL
jgi:hypothetical protein